MGLPRSRSGTVTRRTSRPGASSQARRHLASRIVVRSVVQQFLEAIFQLPVLGGDDYQQGQNDGLADVLTFSAYPITAALHRALRILPTRSHQSGGYPNERGPVVPQAQQAVHKEVRGDPRLPTGPGLR